MAEQHRLAHAVLEGATASLREIVAMVAGHWSYRVRQWVTDEEAARYEGT